ncbi:MAG: cell envelope integrity protein TolA [Massilia sp.]
MKPATAGAQYRVPPEPSRWPAIMLAVAVHALLLAFLWFGISWQNNEPVAVEAEVWDMKTQAAAPVAPPPQEAEPEPQPAPEPPPPAPKVVEPPVEQPVAPPDIKLEREKQRKAEQLKKEQQEREREQELAEKKARDEAKAKDLAEKKAAEKKKADELAKKEAEKKEAEKKDAEKKAKELADKKKADKEAKAKQAAEDAKLAKLHDAEMKHMMALAGSGGAGSAAKSTAPRSDSGYQAAIRAKIQSATTYGGSTDLPGNPKATFRVEQLPTGEIISVKMTKSSGVPSFDDAVEKGIIKSSPLPKKKDGTVERSIVVEFEMKDLN